MANLNKVFLIGNLTKDLELKYGKNGQPVTNMRIAVNRVYTTQSGEKKEEVCYVNIVVWGKQAESCTAYLKKGSSIFVEGRLQLRSWEDEETKQKKSMLEVVADRVQFLDRFKKNENIGTESPENVSVDDETEGKEIPPFLE